MKLARRDIQGNLLHGYGFRRAAYLFLELPEDPTLGRSLLAWLVERVQDARTWEPADRPETATNVALTCAGLRALGVPEAVVGSLSPAFLDPIRERAERLLDDVGGSAPVNWDPHIGTSRSHLLVTINCDTDDDGTRLGTAVDEVLAAAAARGVDLVHRQMAAALHARREHFGWADGLSQPAIEGTDDDVRGHGVRGRRGDWRAMRAGELLHGYPDEDGQTTSGPAAELLRNGTYMVYRKLEQDVTAFREQLQADAIAYAATQPEDLPPGLTDQQLYEVMAAKVVGRWRDGHPVSFPHPDGFPTDLGQQEVPNPRNDFRFRSGGADDDEDGLRCPIGAHIRRTNPRDALGWGGEMSRRHRIVRRGMPYGEYLPLGADPGDRERGLVFVCFNASIERQFEVIQRQWCNDGNAFGLGNEKDYLLGDPTVGFDASPDGRVTCGRVTIQGNPPHQVHTGAALVTTRGCEYLLVPGLGALRKLAEGHWSRPTQEDEDIAAVDEIGRRMMAERYRTARPVLRDQHPKAHGCVEATFTVLPDLPNALRHGLFAEPRTYRAWIRFSSAQGGPKLRRDTAPDAHGMAIKVLDVHGPKVLADDPEATTQDFVLANSDAFFCRNPRDYVELADKVRRNKLGSYFIGVNPFRWRPRELVQAMRATRRVVDHPLQIRYWSQTPYEVDGRPVKWSCRPQSDRRDPRPDPAADDFLAEVLEETLRTETVVFDFQVQRQADPRKMPVEDPTIRWSERRAPFVTVATVTIGPQARPVAERREIGERLAFTPWHSLVAHRPLGGINRARRVAYESISRLRHRENGTTPDLP